MLSQISIEVRFQIQDESQRRCFDSLQTMFKPVVIDKIHELRRLTKAERQACLESSIGWIEEKTTVLEEMEVVRDDICDLFDEEFESEEDEWELLFTVVSLSISMSPADAPKLPDTIRFETVTDVLEWMRFHRGLKFSMHDEDTQNLWEILVTDESHRDGRREVIPIHVQFQQHHQRARRLSRPIECLTEDIGKNPEHATPLLTDKSLSFLYGMVNGFLHQVSTSQSEYSGKFLAFSIAARFEGDEKQPPWFSNLVEQSDQVLSQDMNTWDTIECSRVFGSLFPLATNDMRWFVMTRIDDRIRTILLPDEQGFDKIPRPKPHDKMSAISQQWKCDYITLYLWPVRFGGPRVYLDFHGFRMRVRSSLDARLILHSNCRVIEIDTTDPVFDAHAKEVVNRLVVTPTAELIEGDGIARMIFTNQKDFLEAEKEMKKYVNSRCFSRVYPGEANITEDVVEVHPMDDPVFDSVKQAIQSRPDFIEKSFRK